MAKFSVLNAVLQRRHEMGFSQEYIAEELDMKQSNYSKIESGYNKVRWEELDTLFDILELTVVPRDTRERARKLLTSFTSFSPNTKASTASARSFTCSMKS